MILGCVNNVVIIIFGSFIPLKWYPLWKSHSQVILVFNLDWKHVTSDDLLFSCVRLWVVASVLQYWVWSNKAKSNKKWCFSRLFDPLWRKSGTVSFKAHVCVSQVINATSHFTVWFTVIHVNVVQNNFCINKPMSFRWTGTASFCLTEDSGTKHVTISSTKQTHLSLKSSLTPDYKWTNPFKQQVLNISSDPDTFLIDRCVCACLFLYTWSAQMLHCIWDITKKVYFT